MIPDLRRISPARYLAHHGALAHLPAIAAALGTAPVIVHGNAGIKAVEPTIRTLMPNAPRICHEGFCTEAAIDAVATTVASYSGDVVIALGGGRVLDVAKAAAEQKCVPVITIPTSAATCAAMTALSVLYEENGRWLRGKVLSTCPAATLIDLDVVTKAPRRLLAAGVLDALAKVHEVRLSLRRLSSLSSGPAAAAALCDSLEHTITEVIADVWGRDSTAPEHLDSLAESVIALPGWIGGLAGEANKLAAAHAVHNALTFLPGSKTSLHGELVAFGIIVQA